MRKDGKDTDKRRRGTRNFASGFAFEMVFRAKEKEGKGKNYDKAETDRYDLVSFCFSSYRKSKMRMKYRGLD